MPRTNDHALSRTSPQTRPGGVRGGGVRSGASTARVGADSPPRTSWRRAGPSRRFLPLSPMALSLQSSSRRARKEGRPWEDVLGVGFTEGGKGSEGVGGRREAFCDDPSLAAVGGAGFARQGRGQAVPLLERSARVRYRWTPFLSVRSRVPLTRHRGFPSWFRLPEGDLQTVTLPCGTAARV